MWQQFSVNLMQILRIIDSITQVGDLPVWLHCFSLRCLSCRLLDPCVYHSPYSSSQEVMSQAGGSESDLGMVGNKDMTHFLIPQGWLCGVIKLPAKYRSFYEKALVKFGSSSCLSDRPLYIINVPRILKAFECWSAGPA